MADSDHNNAAAADQNRDDLVSRLKKDLESQTAALAMANASAASTAERMAGYEARERERVLLWQDDAKFFMSEFVGEEVKAHYPQLEADVAVFTADGGWAHTYHEKPDIQAQGALAAVSYVASKGIKRLREQASQGAAAQATLAETMKANEDLMAQNQKLQKDCDDYKILCDERQKGLELMHSEMLKGDINAASTNFTKLFAREKEALPAEPHAAATIPSLEAVKAEASKAAGASLSGNPIQQADLLSSLLTRSTGSLRMGVSGTNHALLGAANGEPDIASILRSSAPIM